MKITIAMLACLAVLSACGGDNSPAATSQKPPVLVRTPWSNAALQDEADRLRTSASLPGLALVVVEQGNITSIVSGKRRAGEAAALQLDDMFQTGSGTKAATAMLIARLVEQKKLRWDSTLAELFPAWRAGMHPSLRAASVEQLLRHRSGVKRELTEADAVLLRPLATGTLAVDRITAARHVLQQAPQFAPNTSFSYSNFGYMLLGMIAEQAGAASYETLMEREVFAPLTIKAGFGFPEDGGAAFASGHIVQGANWVPAARSGEARYAIDLAVAAGGMMLSAKDYGIYLRAHLDGLQRRSRYLAADTFSLMHTPVDGYGHGWGVDQDAVLGRYSAHSGSWNTSHQQYRAAWRGPRRCRFLQLLQCPGRTAARCAGLPPRAGAAVPLSKAAGAHRSACWQRHDAPHVSQLVPC
jgi:D-alanyl-D-alanine carboxypeptidase